MQVGWNDISVLNSLLQRLYRNY